MKFAIYIFSDKQLSPDSKRKIRHFFFFFQNDSNTVIFKLIISIKKRINNVSILHYLSFIYLCIKQIYTDAQFIHSKSEQRATLKIHNLKLPYLQFKKFNYSAIAF